MRILLCAILMIVPYLALAQDRGGAANDGWPSETINTRRVIGDFTPDQAKGTPVYQLDTPLSYGDIPFCTSEQINKYLLSKPSLKCIIGDLPKITGKCSYEDVRRYSLGMKTSKMCYTFEYNDISSAPFFSKELNLSVERNLHVYENVVNSEIEKMTDEQIFRLSQNPSLCAAEAVCNYYSENIKIMLNNQLEWRKFRSPQVNSDRQYAITFNGIILAFGMSLLSAIIASCALYLGPIRNLRRDNAKLKESNASSGSPS